MIPALLILAALPPSTPTLGVAEGTCRAGESGPAFRVSVKGLKDHAGSLKLELYPDNDADFLADDNKLIAAGKPFARVVMPTPAQGVVEMCIRAPRPGRYALSLLHDRNGDRKFSVSDDGIGFSANPRLGWSKPKAATVGATVENMPVSLTIVLNYRKWLSMRPIDPR
jgi:uncharacterized protein (DUF2141 family)